MTDIAIAFRDLGFGYRKDKWVLRRLSGAARNGEVLAILGPNGRGKTTLLRLLLGSLQPLEGDVTVHGRAAFVPQLFQVAFEYSVLDMVVMGRARRLGWFGQPSRRDERAALAALDRFDLAGQARRPFGELSGGQRQLVILARALVAEAEILIMDEPTAALDLKNQDLVLGWIDRLSADDGLTVVFSTHQPGHALAVADRVLLMLGPDAFAIGPPEETLTEARLQSLYGARLRRVIVDDDGREHRTFVPVYSFDRKGVPSRAAPSPDPPQADT